MVSVTHKHLLKFLVSGLINSAVGLLSFVVVLEFVGFSATLANLVSYSFGFLSAFIGMRMWVFPNRTNSLVYLIRFSTLFLLCLFANALVFKVVLAIAPMNPIMAQLAGMGVYTTMFFLLSSQFLQDSDGLKRFATTESESSVPTL